jgi:hypothetical protein
MDMQARLEGSRIISWNSYLSQQILLPREADSLKKAKNIVR